MNRQASGRRAFLLGGTGIAALGLLRPGHALAELLATPTQTAGPFYPTAFPVDADNNLVDVRGAARPAEGQVTHIMGRVLTTGGEPVPGARVEIWQCDARGIYLHPRSDRAHRRDPGFQGYGRAVADGSGGYAFRTIRPVAYAGRTPHIHVGVQSAAGDLVTQMFVAGEPGNDRDFLYRGLDPRARAAVTVQLAPAVEIEAGALAGRFDIVLQG
ncbi:MAG: protocatechuate 3,4-dioxygenase [Sneathiellaceae bacterium]